MQVAEGAEKFIFTRLEPAVVSTASAAAAAPAHATMVAAKEVAMSSTSAQAKSKGAASMRTARPVVNAPSTPPSEEPPARKQKPDVKGLRALLMGSKWTPKR